MVYEYNQKSIRGVAEEEQGGQVSRLHRRAGVRPFFLSVKPVVERSGAVELERRFQKVARKEKHLTTPPFPNNFC